jgi:hypothetical protein
MPDVHYGEYILNPDRQRPRFDYAPLTEKSNQLLVTPSTTLPYIVKRITFDSSACKYCISPYDSWVDIWAENSFEAALIDAVAHSFPNVEALNIWTFCVDEKALRSIAALPKLTSLILQHFWLPPLAGYQEDDDFDDDGDNEDYQDGVPRNSMKFPENLLREIIYAMVTLEHLDIKAIALKEIGQLTRLKSLSIVLDKDEALHIEGLRGIGQLVNLEKLQFKKMSKWPTSSNFGLLNNLRHLRVLELDGIHDDAIAGMTALPMIERLTIQKGELTGVGLAGIASAAALSLRCITFEKCNNIKTIEPLASLQVLEELIISESSLQAGPPIAPLRNFNSLRTLVLTPTHHAYGDDKLICDDLIDFLPTSGKLRKLHIKSQTNSFTDVALKRLAKHEGCSGLEEIKLTLERSATTNKGMRKLGRGVLTKLRTVDVYHRSITAEAYRTWHDGMPTLEILQMYCPKLKKAQVQDLLPRVRVEH